MRLANRSPQGIGLRRRLGRTWAGTWGILLLAAPGVCAGQLKEDPDRPSRAQQARRRVVHRLDFDERKLGNYETVPMHWTRLNGNLFPGFAEAAFDEHVGHTAPPSLRLSTDGRNVGLWYHGPATEVRPNSEYLITGWVCCDRLVHARACLSAYYLDHQGLPIEGTQAFGHLLGSDPQDPTAHAWQRVEIHLPAGPPQARTIGLTAWVVQSHVWDRTPRPHRHIEPQELLSGAWFDDVTVYRMPRAVLATSAPGNFFVQPAPATLQVTVADNDAVGLSATLTVQSPAGRLVHQTDIPVQTARQPQATTVQLTGLTPGLYDAALDIRTGGETAITRRLRFAYLAAEHKRGTGVARPFGVVLDPNHRSDADTELALLSALAVGAVKYPVWSPSPAGAQEAPEGLDPDQLLHDLVKTRVALTGVLGAPPAGLVQSAGQYARSLLEILSEDPKGWRSYLSAVAAPYASVFRTWQLGADGDRRTFNDARLPDVLRQVRRELIPLITTVSLAAPGDAGVAAGDEALPVEEITLRISPDVHADWIASYLQGYRRLDYDRVSAYVGIDRPRDYARTPRLAAFARRIIHTRHAGVDTTYVPQLWHTRGTVNGPVTEPTDTFIVYRTIVDLLRDLAPGPVVRLGDGVVALAFHGAQEAVLAIWDPSAPPEGRTYEFQLGSARRQIDLLGQATPLAEGRNGRRRVRLFPQPVFIDQVERWLVEFVASVELVPAKVEHSLLPQKHTIQMKNTSSKQRAGEVTLEAPDGWQVRPQRFGLRLPPHGGMEQQVELRYRHNEPAGLKQILAIVEFQDDPAYRVEIPLSLELGIRDVDVWGFAFLEGDRLVLHHGVTNRSARPLSLRSFATAPGRSRQFRVIASLAPDESTTAEYRFKDPGVLTGRTVRLGLREVDGPRSHTIELTAP